MGRAYRIGTRNSPLALRQVEEVRLSLRKAYPDIRMSLVGIDTYGDMDKDTPISEIEGSDFFTREIDEALLKGEVDFAIHSAKDLPDKLREGLAIVAITKSIDPDDGLVSRSTLTLDELPRRAKIGTSSLRRKEGLERYRPDFKIVDIRGNIEERLELLDNNGIQRAAARISAAKLASAAEKVRRHTIYDIRSLDAILIACAGLLRLGLSHRITQRIPFEILRPHPLQGALAIVARTADSSLLNLLSAIDARETALV